MFNIRAISRTPLPDIPGMARARWLQPGTRASVPLAAIRDDCEVCHGTHGGAPGDERLVAARWLCEYCATYPTCPLWPIYPTERFEREARPPHRGVTSGATQEAVAA